jgi:O-antigen ligase
VTSALPRLDFTDRRTLAIAGASVVGAVAAALVIAIGTGSYLIAGAVAALALAPAVVIAGVRWPYVFPYGLYAAMVPFDDLLKIPGAGTITRILGLAAAVVVAVHAARTHRLSAPPLALYLWLGFLLWLLAGFLHTPDFEQAQISAQQMVSLVALFAILAVAPVSEQNLRSICGAIVLGGVVASLYGLYLMHNNPQFADAVEGRLTINALGRTADPNGFADALLAPFAIAFVSLLNARKPGRLIVSLCATLLILTAIFGSLSREAIVACVAIVAVVVWFSRRRLLGIALAVPALAAVPFLVPAVAQRMSDALVTGGAGRQSIWRVEWIAFWQHPIFGWGTGGAIEAYNRNYLQVFQPYIAGWSRPPHNTPLSIAIELGVIGLLLFYGAWFAAFRPLVGIDRSSGIYDLRVALTAALVAMLVVAVFVDVSPHKDFWLVLATAAQFATVARSLPRRTAAEPPVRTRHPELVEGRRSWVRRRPSVRNGSST